MPIPPQWPALVGSSSYELNHVISHLWEHVDERFNHLWQHVDKRFNRLSEEISQMSQSLSDQFNAAITKVNADIDDLTTEVQVLLAGMSPGDALTQAQVDAVTAIAARLEAIPAIPTPPATA